MKLVFGVIVVGVVISVAYVWRPEVVKSALAWIGNKAVAAWDWLKSKLGKDSV